MRFDLVDRVVERSAERIVTLKTVTMAEEYLADHFPTFPVLPGVLMLEAMVQAARRLLEGDGPAALPLVLGQVRAFRYGRFVRPGDTLVVEVTRTRDSGEGVECRGEAFVVADAIRPGERVPACSGRFVLRPARLAAL